jgi:predicted nucleotidyltransferase
VSGTAGKPDLNATGLLGLLTARGVDFVVIGGVAAILHGGALYTQDLDICHAIDPVNLRALAKALIESEATLRGAPDGFPFTPDEHTLRRVEVLTLDTSAGKLDLLAKPDGAPPYRTLRERAERMDVGAFAVLVAGIPDLIAMKRAAGRPKDEIAAEELEVIRRLREQGVGPPEEG